MKKYLPDFFVGLGLGIFLLILAMFAGPDISSWKDWAYEFIVFLLLFSGYFSYFRRPKKISITPSLISFFVGYCAPIIIWIFLVFTTMHPEIG